MDRRSVRKYVPRIRIHLLSLGGEAVIVWAAQ
jgi:hypothetical protein